MNALCRTKNVPLNIQALSAVLSACSGGMTGSTDLVAWVMQCIQAEGIVRQETLEQALLIYSKNNQDRLVIDTLNVFM